MLLTKISSMLIIGLQWQQARICRESIIIISWFRFLFLLPNVTFLQTLLTTYNNNSNYNLKEVERV